MSDSSGAVKDLGRMFGRQDNQENRGLDKEKSCDGKVSGLKPVFLLSLNIYDKIKCLHGIVIVCLT